MPAPSLRGRFVWHELMTTDPDAAARFYPAVTGWKVQTWEHNPAYRLWTMGGAPMAGLMALPDHSRRMGTPPAWLSYVDRKSTRLNSSHLGISYAVFCLKKKKRQSVTQHPALGHNILT